MKKIIFALFLFACGFSATALSDARLTILHTNDIHAHLLSSNQSGQDCTEGLDCLGGLARLQTFVISERKKNSDILFLDAGDFFSGTFFYTFHKDNDLIFLFNQLDFDAITLGNHEFDDTSSVIEHFLKNISTPCINSHIEFKGNPYLNKRLKQSLILTKNKLKIGILGALTEDVKTSAMHGDMIKVSPVIPALEKEIKYLKNQGISTVILLSHLGLEKDKELAHKLPDLDIIIGGHTHNLLSNTISSADAPYPLVIEHRNGAKTLIVSTGAFGHFVGKLNVAINEQGHITSYAGDTIPLSLKIQQNSKIANYITEKSQELDSLLNTKITTLSQPILMTEGKNYCSKDCPIGSSITEMVLSEVSQADIVLLNSGAIRSGFDKGDILLKHIFQVLPFDSTAVLTSMTGQQLWQYIEKGLTSYQDGKRTNIFLQIAGASYQFNSKTRKLEQIIIDGKKINLMQNFKVVLPLFLAKGGDNFPPIKNYQTLSKSMREMVQDYLSKTSLK